ncbi:MAG: hypothetical protein EZS28_036713 [Streblomastix strix]|uniref:Uncharacterized protein n=1 Tax=Streblomastix strix TaxID=222440 RepID=A0A5J4UCW9_9EUKA|nr:MAG: hypothetical protein EZS28_036712 [Streblomastix strix]KAA6367761.1 MAG: hypothetical protein EZS28_036713 [Streblomastix strix]
MSIQIPAIQQHANNLKQFVQGKLTCILLNGDEIGIQAYADSRPQCVIVPISTKDADLHIPVDRSEPRVSTMVAVTLNGEKLCSFLITSQDFDEIELL